MLIRIIAWFRSTSHIPDNLDREYVDECRKEAAQYAGYLHDPKQEYDLVGMVESFRELLARGNLSVSEFDITEDHLNQLLRQGYLRRGKSELEILRRGTTEYRFAMKEFHRSRTLFQLPIEAFGTTHEELREIRRQCRKFTALNKLNLVRSQGVFSDTIIAEIRQEIANGGWTLEDIGSNEAEIGSFVRRR